MSADDLNRQMGVLARREVEARIVGPLVEAFAKRFGRQETLEVVDDVVRTLAVEAGQALRTGAKAGGLEAFAAEWEPWTRGGALEIDVLEQTADRWDFNVRKCRYADMYRSLGRADLGATLSCARDAALVHGFDEGFVLERTQTIMEGAPFCDFRFRSAGQGEAEIKKPQTS